MPSQPPHRDGTRGAARGWRILLASAVLTLAACSSPAAPEVPAGPDGSADPVLVEGRSVFVANCARCHGSAGEGGTGLKLNEGRALESFPDAADMIDVVTSGRNGMPGFGGSLEEDEIEAVVRYIREVL